MPDHRTPPLHALLLSGLVLLFSVAAAPDTKEPGPTPAPAPPDSCLGPMPGRDTRVKCALQQVDRLLFAIAANDSLAAEYLAWNPIGLAGGGFSVSATCRSLPTGPLKGGFLVGDDNWPAFWKCLRQPDFVADVAQGYVDDRAQRIGGHMVPVLPNERTGGVPLPEDFRHQAEYLVPRMQAGDVGVHFTKHGGGYRWEILFLVAGGDWNLIRPRVSAIVEAGSPE